MKKIFTSTLLLLAAHASFSQNATSTTPKLEKLLNAEIGMAGLALGMDLPLSSTISIDISTGIGGQNLVKSDEFSYKISLKDNPSFFAKSFLKCYINRGKRFSKNKRITNNAGSFIGFQTKFNTNNDELGKVLLNDLNWGQQIPISKRWIFNYNIGGGIGYNFDLDIFKLFPSIGFKFSYIICSMK